MNGPARSWACSVAYAIGRANFLFDKTQQPHMRADALCQHFGLSVQTGSGPFKHYSQPAQDDEVHVPLRLAGQERLPEGIRRKS
ncbi:DUF6398 domain-containing protein [Paraburkholderia xenovorans]